MKKIIFLNFLIIFVIIITLEIITNFFKLSGLMGIQDGLIYKKNGINYLYPNKQGVIFNKEIFTDQFGFRVPNSNFNYINDENIFILGDSVAFGNGIIEDSTFVGLMRKNITNKNFLNTSVPGYQIKDHINVIKKIDNFQNIEKILYFYTLNDIYNSSNLVNSKKNINKINNSNEGSFRLKDFKLFNKLNTFFRNKSYLYMFVKGVGTDPSKRWFSNLYPQYLNQDFLFLKKNFKILHDISKKNNSEFIVIILPYEYQTRKCSNENLLPQKEIANILNNLSIQYRDMTDDFCNEKKPNNNFYKFDPMHLSKKGHMLVYNLIINEINF